MALQEQAVVITFAGGIETKQDRKAVPTTKLLTLQNGVFTKAASIVKRNGYRQLGMGITNSSTLLTGARRLAARDDEMLAFASNRCFSYQPTADEWSDAGPVFSVSASDAPAVITGTDQTMPDHATNGGLTVYAWEDSRGGVWWTCVDSSTGRVCRAPEQLDASGQTPRCARAGTALHIYWANASQQSIFVVVVNPQEPNAAVTPLSLVHDLNPSVPFFDAESTSYAGAPAIMAWVAFGTSNLRIAFIHPSGVLGAPSLSLPSSYTEVGAGVTGAVSISAWRAGAAAKFAVAFDASNVTVNTYELVTTGGVTRAQRDSSTVVDAGIAPKRLTAVMMDAVDMVSGQPPVWVTYELIPGGFAQPSQAYIKTSVVNATAPVQTLRSVGLVSRAFQVDGDPLVVVVHDTDYFNVYLTLRLSDLFVIGRHLAGSGAGLPPRQHVASVQIDPALLTTAAVALSYRERLISENNDQFRETGIRRIELDFDDDNSHVTAQLGRGLYLAGACPMHYDGRAWTEQGFHVGPEHITPTSGPGGGLTSSETYEYIVWYEWTDAQGEVHRGPTSIGTDVVMGATDTQVTLILPTLRVTGKTNVRICVARSQGDDETELNRVSSLDPNTAGQPNGYIANDPTVDSVTFIDQMDDITAEAQEPLYTNGGILSNDPATLGNGIAIGKSRLFFTDPSDPQVIHYSQEIDPGYGAELPPDLVQRCDPYGGAVTALAVMDDTVIALKESALHGFNGDGPLANGDASTTGFSATQLITSDAGCTDPASIALTPVGIMFKSAKGIMMLDRSKTLSYVGASVEGFNAQRITRTTLLPDRTQIIFLTDSGSTLLYDYLFGQWSTFTNHEGLDAIVVGGRYYYLRTDGNVFVETPGEYSDAGRPIVMRFETAWIKMTQYLQSFARFYRAHLLGEGTSPHQLVMQVRTDYGAHWSAPMYLDATSASSSTGWITGDRAGAIGAEPLAGSVYGDGPYGDGPYGGTPAALYQWRAHLGIVGQAIQFRFEDFQAAGLAGPSFELSELLITGGVKGNARRPFSAGRST